LLMEVSPGRFWKGDTNWINNCFVLDVSVIFSTNRPVRSHFVEWELKEKSFSQLGRSFKRNRPFLSNNSLFRGYG